MSSGQTVLILGGGIGGVVAANELRELLPKEHRVVVVEKNPEHTFAPSYLWLMTGDRTPEQIRVPVSRLLNPGVELVHAEATKIDLENRRVETTHGSQQGAKRESLPYDHLILALGADLAMDAIPGLAESAQTYYSFEGAQKLRDALRGFQGGKVAVVVSALPYKCPGAPHEGAMLIADFFRKRGRRDKVEVALYTPEPAPMPVAGPELGENVVKMLGSKGIGFFPSHKLQEVHAGTLQFEGKDPVPFDLLVAIPPHRSPAVVRDTGLTNEGGWIPVEPATLKTPREGVYALGDCAFVPLPGRWKPDVPLVLPKAGVFAHAQAQVVARNVASAILGAAPKEAFCGGGYCMLEAGDETAGFAFGDFFGTPSPQVHLRKVGRSWHLGKELFEKWWLAPPGPKRALLGLMIRLGGKILRVPVVL